MALGSITPSDVEFKEAFEICKVSNPKIARYYLRSLEMAANKESEPWFTPLNDRSVINLEHVLPKRPEGKWPQFTQDEAENYVNRLGNQALLRAGDNANLRNAAFSEKKKVYAESPYILTNQIAEADDWTLSMIGDRQKELAVLSIEVWPL